MNSASHGQKIECGLMDKEWEVLNPAAKIQQAMSYEKTPVLAGAVPALHILIIKWHEMSEQSTRMADLIAPGLVHLEKYLASMKESPAYIITMVCHLSIPHLVS